VAGVIALVVNTGSTSVRLALWKDAERLSGERLDLPADADARIAQMVDGRAVDLVVHRVVHGGARRRATVVDRAVLEEIRALVPLAPNHNPRALEWIEACVRVLPNARHVAAFDTAFFAGLPANASTYALPRELVKKHGLRRYGFHGLAHASMWHAWVEKTGAKDARVITLQLGGGCSAAAIAAGKPLDTSMGMTPLEGLVMATRAGDVDPGLLFHLQRVEGLSPDALEEVLAKRSGLLGLSGRSGDLRELARATDDPDVRLALDVFVHRARKCIGAYMAVLEGIDGIVMGGGISEHWPDVRARILSGFEWSGVSIDASSNAAARAVTAPIHAASSRVQAWVAAIDEELELLRLALEA
jgi:acetate kinase